jgi:hypothetical protein
MAYQKKRNYSAVARKKNTFGNTYIVTKEASSAAPTTVWFLQITTSFSLDASDA